MSRVRNPEVYVKGYGKNTSKDDLKSWFREFGKIVCIQYKGPYSFIVNQIPLRSSKTTSMQKLLSSRWMIAKLRATGLLSNLQEWRKISAGTVPAVTVGIGGPIGTREEEITLLLAHLLPPTVPVPHLRLTLGHHQVERSVAIATAARRRKRSDPCICEWIDRSTRATNKKSPKYHMSTNDQTYSVKLLSIIRHFCIRGLVFENNLL